MTSTYQIELDRTANTPVTEGIHSFEIVSGEEAEGPKGPYWRFTLTCLTPAEEGKNVSFIVSLSPQARWRLEIFLDAVRAPSTGTATIDKFINRKLRAKVVHEDFEGRTQARLTELFPAVAGSSPASVKPVVKAVKVEEPKELPADIVDEYQEELPF